MKNLIRSSVVLSLTLGACQSAGATGTLNMAASGEAAAVDGYPSSEGIGYVDGWTMTWDHLLISVSTFYVEHNGVRTALPEADQVVINLHDAEIQNVWSFPGLAAQRYEDVGYQIDPITPSNMGSVRRIGTVTDAQLSTMAAGGIAYWLHGTAHHPDHHDVVLDLQIPMHTSMSMCMNAMDMTDGLVVTPNGMANLQLTFHLDHVFFDSIVNPEPDLRFEAYAAAAGSDYVVTFDELASQPLADLHDIDGSPAHERRRAALLRSGQHAARDARPALVGLSPGDDGGSLQRRRALHLRLRES